VPEQRKRLTQWVLVAQLSAARSLPGGEAKRITVPFRPDNAVVNAGTGRRRGSLIPDVRALPVELSPGDEGSGAHRSWVARRAGLVSVDWPPRAPASRAMS
jgi:hypothetical protein